MEDQGKRLLLAVGIAFALMLGWQLLFPPEKKPTKPKQDDATAQTGDRDAGADGTPTAGGDETDRAEAVAAEAIERGDEQVFTFEFEQFTAKLSTYGAALTSWTLAGEAFEDRDKKGNPPLDLVRTGDVEEWRPLTVWFADSSYGIPDGVEWTPSNQSDTTIDFTWESEYLRVIKKYEFKPEDYLLMLTVDVTVLAAPEEGGEAKQALAISTFGFAKPTGDSGGGFMGCGGGGNGGGMGAMPNRKWEAQCYRADDEIKAANPKELADSDRGQSGTIRWAGFAHGYFLTAISPRYDKEEVLACSATGLERDGAMEMTLFYPELTLEEGEGFSRTVTAFFGPKFMDRLEDVSGIVGYDTAFGEAVDLGMLSFIARPLLWLLKFFQGFVVNWGIAIILLTLVVQAITLPWTAKSMRSMKAMAKLRPQMDKIKEKYPDDKQRQQVEMMNLYKAHKINPLAGCLPMILQMPIWFALYRSLSVAAELYQVPFIPGWLDDLTAPDPYYVMPVLLLGMMFLQTKLQPNPVESTQQKIMMYGMPLMFGFFSLFFPSGLTLYILTNTIIRTSHQHYLNRKDGDGARKDEPKDKAKGDEDGDGDEPHKGRAKRRATTAGSSDSDTEPQQSQQKKKQGGKGKKKKRSRKPRKTGGRAAKA